MNCQFLATASCPFDVAVVRGQVKEEGEGGEREFREWRKGRERERQCQFMLFSLVRNSSQEKTLNVKKKIIFVNIFNAELDQLLKNYFV